MNTNGEHHIIDDEIGQPPGKLWSKASAVFAIITLVLVGIFFTLFESKIKATTKVFFVYEWLSKATYVTTFMGLFATVMSFVKKEKLKYFKAIAATVHLLYLMLILATVFYGIYRKWR